jgi:enamine deaminase RidA (YjgF/YER057c/UK114 family)
VEQVYKNIEAACKAHGGSLANVVNHHLRHGLGYFPVVRDARTRIYGVSPPTSRTVVVKSLANSNFLVEIEAIAYIE